MFNFEGSTSRHHERYYFTESSERETQLLSDSRDHSDSQKFLGHSGHGDDLHENIETIFPSKATDCEPNTDLIHITVPDQLHCASTSGDTSLGSISTAASSIATASLSSEAVNSSIDEVVDLKLVQLDSAPYRFLAQWRLQPAFLPSPGFQLLEKVYVVLCLE